MNPIPFARPFIGREEEEAVLAVLRSGWLTTGREALAFEEEFAAFLNGGGQKGQTPARALAVNSATSALHLALEALGVGQGDVALVPTLTFTASAETARYLGAEIAFIDTAPASFHLSAASLRSVIENLLSGKKAYGDRGPVGKPKVIIPVHYGGLPCDMDAILKAASEYRIAVVEDCAHCFPSFTEDARALGTLGDAGVFSFYATKTMTTGEGGMLVSRDPELLKRVSLMRLHGIDRPAWNRYTDVKSSWYYEITEAGYKYNMPDILAALGRAQLKRALFLLAERRRIATCYDEAFAGNTAFIVPPTGPADARHLYPLRTRNAEDRDTVIAALRNAGIGVSVHFIPLHTMPYYKNRYNLNAADFPHAMDAFRAELSLPIWPGMTAAEINRVIAVVTGKAGYL